MKIQHVIIGLEVGGAEMMLKRLIESHAGNPGYQHSVISLTDLGSVGRQLAEQGVSIRAMGMRSPLDIFRVLPRLRRALRESKPDVVQTWMYHSDLLGGLAARWAGIKNVIWCIHSTDANPGGSRMTPFVMRACALLSSWVPRRILCVAEASKRVHVAAGYDASRMLVVPNGLDLSRLVATEDQRLDLRAGCGFTADHFVIGTVGRFNPAKDYENFVRAAGIVAAQCENVRYLMVGSKLDRENAVLARWIAETGYADRFVLLGERSDAAVCLAAMDAFCLSSRSEALPTVVAEAMALGVPCVATDVGDTANLVGDAGVIVRPEDPVRLAEALVRMASTPGQERATLGKKSKERVRSEYTIERARARFESIYCSVVENKKG